MMTPRSELPAHEQGHSTQWQSQVRQQLEEELERRVRAALHTPPVERLRRRLNEKATSCDSIVDYDQLNAHLDLAAKAKEYRQRRKQRARNLLGSLTDRNATSCSDLTSRDGRHGSGECSLAAGSTLPRGHPDDQDSSADLEPSEQQLNSDAADSLSKGSAENASARSSETNLWSAVLQPMLPAPSFIDVSPEVVEPLWLEREGPDVFETQRTPYSNQKWRGGATVVFDSLRSPKQQEPMTAGGGSSSAINAPSLIFESRFESGNLQLARRIGQFEYELLLKTDLYTKRHTQWYYFRIQNAMPGIIYKFRITNFLKKDSLYNYGMKPLFYSEVDAKKRNIGWIRKGHHIRYSLNTQHLNTSLHLRDMTYYELEWQIEFDNASDTCYLAHCYPYTFSDLKRDLDMLMADPQRGAVSRREVLCETKAGNSCFLVTVTNFESRAPKKCIVVSARVHPGESNASWMMKGLLEYITSDEPEAVELRKAFIFKIVPMLNPDGVIIGNYRCDLTGKDLNRNYRWPEKHSFPTVAYTKAMVEQLQHGMEVLIYCDLHGHSKKSNVFMYGCNSPESIAGDINAYIAERLFPFLISRQAPDVFSFPSCKFKIQKKKESTGRVVMYRQMKIKNSFTLEATFSGTLLDRQGARHFNQKDYQHIGRIFCIGLHEYMQVLEDKGKETEAVVGMTRALMQRLLKHKVPEEPVGRSELPTTSSEVRPGSSPKNRLLSQSTSLLRGCIRSSPSLRKLPGTINKQRQALPKDPVWENAQSSAKLTSLPNIELFACDPHGNREISNMTSESEKSVLLASMSENIGTSSPVPATVSSMPVVTIEACSHLLQELMIGTTGAISGLESDSSSDSDSAPESELKQVKAKSRKKKAAKSRKKKIVAEAVSKRAAAKPTSKISHSMVELSEVGRRQSTAPSQDRKPPTWHPRTQAAENLLPGMLRDRPPAAKPARTGLWMLPSINKHHSCSTDAVQQLGGSAKGRLVSDKEVLQVNGSDGARTKLPVKRPSPVKSYHWVNPYVGRTNGGIPCFSERRSLQRAARRMSDALRQSCKELWEAACGGGGDAGAGDAGGGNGDSAIGGYDAVEDSNDFRLTTAVSRDVTQTGSADCREGCMHSATIGPSTTTFSADDWHSVTVAMNPAIDSAASSYLAVATCKPALQYDEPSAASSNAATATIASFSHDHGPSNSAVPHAYSVACCCQSTDESTEVHLPSITYGLLSDGLRAQLLLPALVPRRSWPSEVHPHNSLTCLVDQHVPSRLPYSPCRFHSIVLSCLHHDCYSVKQPSPTTSCMIARHVELVGGGDSAGRPENMEGNPEHVSAPSTLPVRATTADLGHSMSARRQAAAGQSLERLEPCRSQLLALPDSLYATELHPMSHCSTEAHGSRVVGQQLRLPLPNLPMVKSHRNSYLTEILRIHSVSVQTPRHSSQAK